MDLYLRKVTHPQAHNDYRVLLKDDGIEIGTLSREFEAYEPGGEFAYPDELAVNQAITFTGRRARLQIDGDPDSFGTAPDAKALTEALTGMAFEDFGSGAVIIIDTKGTTQ